ncbi:MAG: hypothetical protein ACFFE4_23740, partial [Candidatus Thorarchaeota archaeon]
SQSGGHLTQLIDVGVKRDIRFRYGVSFGNQIDLNCVDLLHHYRHHEGTKHIAAYLESFGSSNGHEFFLQLKKTTLKKPVILWKGGYTQDGSRAAFSHTGAIASNFRMWKAMVKQTGTTLVKDNEEFWNTIKTFEILYPNYIPKGRNIGIITPGGGASVNLTDLFAYYNLKIPIISRDSQDKLAEILPKVNVILNNPIDLGASGFVIDIYIKCLKILATDPNIDILIIPLWPDHVYRYIFKRMVKNIEKVSSKPFAFCMPSLADSGGLANRFNVAKKYLHRDRILYFLSLRDAASSFSHYCDYIDFLKSRNIIKGKD